MKNYFKIIKYKEKNKLCNINHKKLPLKYIVKIIKNLKKCYLRKYLISYIRVAGYTKNMEWCYVSDFAIDIILKEMKYRKENKKWRTV